MDWQQNWGFVAHVLFPRPAPTYTIDSFPGELVWIPRRPGVVSVAAASVGSNIADEKQSEQPNVIVPSDAGGTGTYEHGVRDSISASAIDVEHFDSVPCLLLTYESARFLIIYFHSNAEDLGRCRWFCQFLRDQFQVHVLAVEYPGYGVCPGTPSTKEDVLANAFAAIHFVLDTLKLPLEHVKIFGRSIGTGPAMSIASRFRVAGLVLVTPFLSVRTLFQDKVGPLARLVDEWFANDVAIDEIRSPTMIIHGRKDMIIPWYHSETLYNACTARKLFISPVSMEHNTNLVADVSFLIMPMFRFFSLPDYCFRQLKVPSWAFDKRQSPFYIRPDVQICSRGLAPKCGGLQGKSGIIELPPGDDREDGTDAAKLEVDLESAREGSEDFAPCTARREATVPRSSPHPGGLMATKAPGTAVRLAMVSATLTNSTVRHDYRATKRRYDFHYANKGYPGDDELPIVDMNLLRRSPLGMHRSASRPPTSRSSSKHSVTEFSAHDSLEGSAGPDGEIVADIDAILETLDDDALTSAPEQQDTPERLGETATVRQQHELIDEEPLAYMGEGGLLQDVVKPPACLTMKGASRGVSAYPSDHETLMLPPASRSSSASSGPVSPRKDLAVQRLFRPDSPDVAAEPSPMISCSRPAATTLLKQETAQALQQSLEVGQRGVGQRPLPTPGHYFGSSVLGGLCGGGHMSCGVAGALCGGRPFGLDCGNRPAIVEWD